MTHVLTKSERERIVSAWRAMYPAVEIIKPREAVHEGQYCFNFQSLQVDIEGHRRHIMARTKDDNARVDFHVARGDYNNRELLRLELLLSKRGIVPVTIGYVSSGRMGNIRQMHYVAVPELGQSKKSLQYVFN